MDLAKEKDLSIADGTNGWWRVWWWWCRRNGGGRCRVGWWPTGDRGLFGIGSQVWQFRSLCTMRCLGRVQR